MYEQYKSFVTFISSEMLVLWGVVGAGVVGVGDVGVEGVVGVCGGVLSDW